MAYRYIIYGCELESDLEFPQLVKLEDESEYKAQHESKYETDNFIRIAESKVIPEEIKNRDENSQYLFGDKLSWLENKSLIMWIENGNSISFVRKPNANENYIRAYLLGFGLSMLFLQQGKLMMHCSAVRKDDKAVLLCGESGCGKSTITSLFLEDGYKLMADDVALIDKKENNTIVYPAFPYQKLCRDAAINGGYNLEELLYIDEDKDKFLVPYRDDFKISPADISAIIILAWNHDEKIKCEEITGLHKINGIAENLFLRKLLGADKYKPEIGSLCLRYGASIPMFFISRNKEKCLPQDVASVIEGIL